MFKVKGRRLRSRRNVTYQQQKCSKTATDRLSDFELGIGDEIKQIGTGAVSGCLNLQCIAIATFSSFILSQCTLLIDGQNFDSKTVRCIT